MDGIRAAGANAAIASAGAVKVTVRFFASLREETGRESLDLELEDATINGVRASLAAVLGKDAHQALNAPGVRVAVNQALAQGAVVLRSGDEVAFLPPVTGG